MSMTAPSVTSALGVGQIDRHSKARPRDTRCSKHFVDAPARERGYFVACRCLLEPGGEIMMIHTIQARRLLVVMAAAAAIALPFHRGRALSAEPPPPQAQNSTAPDSSSDSKKKLDTVTIEGQREIKHQIDDFVYGAVVSYMNDSLMRWDTPICPIVAGLPNDQGEYILARLSQVARDAHVPLAGEHCRKPNLLVVVSDQPDSLAKKWAEHDKTRLNTCNGQGYLKDFVNSRRPVRAYYNGKFLSSDGEELSQINNSAFSLYGLNIDLHFGPCVSGSGVAIGTRLRYGSVQGLQSVIILVDGKRANKLNIGQLADYITLVGLAQIRPDANTGTAPTILTVFTGADPQPQGLSHWDESFLRGLYTTKQSSVIQTSLIKASMFDQLRR